MPTTAVHLDMAGMPAAARRGRSGSGVDRDTHPVKGGLDMGGKPRLEFRIIEVGMHIGQDRPPGLDALDPGHCVVHAEVARMRLVAQRIHDPEIETRQGFYARVRQVDEVARIGDRAEAKTQRRKVAMVLEERQDGDRPPLPSTMTGVPGAIRCSVKIGG